MNDQLFVFRRVCNIKLQISGGIPGPIIIGFVFDSSCLVWQERCGQTGACWIYDSDSMSQKLVLALAVIKGVSFVTFLLAYIVYKPPEKQMSNSIDKKDFDNKSVPTEGTNNAANGVDMNFIPLSSDPSDIISTHM